MGVVNGKIPASSLTKLSTPGALLKGPAASFERLNKEATMTVGTTNALQAYRSLAQQKATFLGSYDTKYRAGRTVANGGKKVYQGKTYYRKDGKAVAAVPGTSNHGVGVAVDWQGLDGFGTKDYLAFAKLAAKHGWNNTEGKKIKEYWHWVYVEKNDKVLAALKAAAAKKAAARARLVKIQGILGVKKTGLPDAATLAAWKKLPNGKPKVSKMAKCQQALNVADDGVRGPITNAAFTKTCKEAK